MQKYSDYKSSSVEWLGDVPSHWKVDKLKNYCNIFASNVDKKIEAEEIEVLLCNYVDVYKNEKIDRSIDFMTASATQTEIEKFTLQLNDIILTKDSETPDDIAVPAIVKEVFENFLCGYHLSIIRCQKKIEPDFLIWALRDLNIATQFHREAVGITRFGLASKHFKNGIFAIPSRIEQTIIANYLDQATVNIDKVIATKQKQLQKLEQYKQSKIHQCVTKGLNPDVQLIDSGIDWIGDVPSHWRLDKISRMVEFSASGGTPTSTNENYYGGDIKWVQTGELNDCEIFDSERKLTEEGFKASSTKMFPPETLLVAMYGATIGKLGILKTEATTNQACCALFFHPQKWNTKFFFYYFLNIRKKLIFSSYGGGQPNISQEVIKQERLFVPKFNEQNAIAEYLDNFCEKIRKEKSIIELQIEKLKQYRKCLIHECVTGKRKVIE